MVGFGTPMLIANSASVAGCCIPATVSSKPSGFNTPCKSFMAQE